MQLGFVGFGRMGSRMVEKLLEEGHEVIGWNRTRERLDELKSKIDSSSFDKLRTQNDNVGDFKVADSVKDLVGQLEKPRIIWLMLPAGEVTEEVLKQVQDDIAQGDIVIDGGNAHYSDTQRRYEQFKEKGVRFLGIGVSGGLIARDAGYPLMVGGDREAYLGVKPLLDSLAKPGGGHEYFGEGGAGHYVKMVHNGIEYGYMQAIGEGFGIMEKSPYDLDLQKVAKLYQAGSLVSGFMMERATEVLDEDPKLEKLEGVVDASGEAMWTLEEAEKLGVPAEVIEEALEFRQDSQKDPKIAASFAARMVAALRKSFGGHEVKRR